MARVNLVMAMVNNTDRAIPSNSRATVNNTVSNSRDTANNTDRAILSNSRDTVNNMVSNSRATANNTVSNSRAMEPKVTLVTADPRDMTVTVMDNPVTLGTRSHRHPVPPVEVDSPQRLSPGLSRHLARPSRLLR